MKVIRREAIIVNREYLGNTEHHPSPNMAVDQTQKTVEGDRALHDLKPLIHIPPLHNSIPAELIDRFDPVYVDYYNKYNAGRISWDEVPIEEFRKNPSKYSIIYGRAAGPDVFRITEQRCPVRGGEITIRIFEPAPLIDSNGLPTKRAAFVNFHGGCWIVGSLSSDHSYCKQLVDGLEGDLVVFDVDYRLAPEHPYPIPIEDCWEAFKWVCYDMCGMCSIQIQLY